MRARREGVIMTRAGSMTALVNRENAATIALPTVVRQIPNCAAIRALGTPSAASRLISAHSSTVITLQSSSVYFSTVEADQFSRAAGTTGRATRLWAICGAGRLTS